MSGRLLLSIVRALSKDAKVRVSCKGKGCAFKRKRVRNRGGDLNLLKALKRVRLKKGAVLEVRLKSASGQIKIARYVMRRGRAPRTTYRCAATIGGKLGACA